MAGFCLIAPALGAQTASPPSGVILGRVVEADTDRGVAGAVVRLSTGPATSATARGSGGPPAGARISGRLLDQADRPAPELFVIAFPVDPSLWHERSRWMREPAHPASDGQFVFTGFPAGEYYLAVLPTLEGGWREPAYLEQVVPGALRVTLAEGERRTQDIRLAR